MMSLHPLLAQRTSTRAFDPTHEVDDVTLVALLDAARWAPSSMNRQPWRFAVARRGTALHGQVLTTLHGGNRRWAADAAALVVALAERQRDGLALGSADYDLGLAVAQLTVQASALGLATHQMGGFDHPALTRLLQPGEGVHPVVVVAVGSAGDPSRLPADLREREHAPRKRRPLEQTVLAWDDGPAERDDAAPAA
jgi:nitroreductase